MRATLFAALAAVAALPAAAESERSSAPATTYTDNLRIQTGISPTLSLSTPSQTWDLMGDGSGFYVIDASASTMPLWIQAGAPSNSFVLSSAGGIGLGTDSPRAAVHVRRSNGTAQLLVREASRVRSGRTMMSLSGTGPVSIAFENTTLPLGFWRFGYSRTANGNLAIGGGIEALALTSAGNMTIAGALTQMSSRDSKEQVEAVDAGALLERVGSLPLSTWSYKADSARHVGPMAQDFFAAFGLGTDDTHIAPADMAGVGLVAAQALELRARELRRQLERIEERLRAQDAELVALDDELRALEPAARPSRP